MGSLEQVDNKFGLKNSINDAVPTAEVFNIQIAANPTHADRFFLTPYCYRFVSAGGSAWEEDKTIPSGLGNRPSYKRSVYGTRYVSLGANVSATMSAVSCEINLACVGTEGATAVCAVGSRTDITATATQAGAKIECYLIKESTAGKVAITRSTIGTGAMLLPEGYASFVTSAGNTVYASSPAEAHFLRESGRHPSQQI